MSKVKSKDQIQEADSLNILLSAKTFDFFSELASNNNKVWWHKNLDSYLNYVKQPLEHLANELSVNLGQYRIYRPNRDIRFSKDKSPYKTFAAFWIAVGTVGYYLEINQDRVMLGGGIYEPANDQLLAWRRLFDTKDKAQIQKMITQLSKEKLELLQDGALKSAPKGWKSTHPEVKFLRLTHLVVSKSYPKSEILQDSSYAKTFQKDFEQIQKWNKLLEKLVGASRLEFRK